MNLSKSINKYLFFLVEMWTVYMSSLGSDATPVGLPCIVFIAGKLC